MFSSDFFKINSFKKLFQENDQSQCHTVLDPDQAWHNVGLDQGPNCLQRLSAEELAGKELNLFFVWGSAYEPRHEISDNVVWATSSLRSALAYTQSDQSFCLSLEYSMTFKLLTEHNLDLLSLTGGCTGLSESTFVKLTQFMKSHDTGQLLFMIKDFNYQWGYNIQIYLLPFCWLLRLVDMQFCKQYSMLLFAWCVIFHYIRIFFFKKRYIVIGHIGPSLILVITMYFLNMECMK